MSTFGKAPRKAGRRWTAARLAQARSPRYARRMRSIGSSALACLLAGIAGAATAGCSTSSAPSTTDDAGSVEGDAGLDGDPRGGPASDAAVDGGRGDTTCQTKAPTACVECCKARHVPAQYLLQQAVLACVCAPEHCQVTCKDTWCADPLTLPASPACDSCVGALTDGGGNGGCSPSVKAACNADDDCSALTSCVRACGDDAGK